MNRFLRSLAAAIAAVGLATLLAAAPVRADDRPQGYLGVKMTMGSDGRAVILEVTPGTPAAAAGLKKGDAIIAADGRELDGLGEFVEAIRAKRPGERIALEVERGEGFRRELSIKLAAKPALLDEEREEAERRDAPSFDLERFSRALREREERAKRELAEALGEYFPGGEERLREAIEKLDRLDRSPRSDERSEAPARQLAELRRMVEESNRRSRDLARELERTRRALEEAEERIRALERRLDERGR